MSDTAAPPGLSAPAQPPARRPLLVVGLACAVLAVAGLAGGISAAPGYALFVLAGVSLAACVAVAGVLVMTGKGDTARLVEWARQLGGIGLAAYVLAVAALAGHYSHETLHGRMELHWIVFGPVVLAALVAFDVGVYRKLVKANAVAWTRYRRFMGRQDADPAAMRKTLLDDVVVHRNLWRVSRLRWLRHTLIFWGFGAMFLVELAAVFVREAMPAFGWPDAWRTPGHPVRLAFDLAYDVTGVMMLVGCLLALYWRATVRGRPERKYADTPMVLFLLFVVLTGFAVEGLRIAHTPADAHHAYSFAGGFFAWTIGAMGTPGGTVFRSLWLVHVVASCALIAYLPATRLVHTCATPLGRLMNSQKGLLAAKKRGVLGGLMRPTFQPGPLAGNGSANRTPD